MRIHFFFIMFFGFVPFVIIFTGWFLLERRYFNATALSKDIDNEIKQNFPRFPSFRFWV